jgi:hypothetical protein
MRPERAAPAALTHLFVPPILFRDARVRRPRDPRVRNDGRLGVNQLRIG